MIDFAATFTVGLAAAWVAWLALEAGVTAPVRDPILDRLDQLSAHPRPAVWRTASFLIGLASCRICLAFWISLPIWKPTDGSWRSLLAANGVAMIAAAYPLPHHEED